MTWLGRGRRGPKVPVEDLLGAAEEALDDSEPAAALRLADRALRNAQSGVRDGLTAEAQVLRAAALFDLGRFADAERAAAQARKLDPSNPLAHYEHGAALYRRGRFEEAAAAHAEAVRVDPQLAEAWHGLGRARTWAGETRGADEALRRAAALDPQRFTPPVRVAAGEFDRIAAAAFAAIPAAFRARMANTLVVAELLPDADEVEEGFDPDTLGVYDGGSVLDDDGPFERIVIYQRNHEAVCDSLGALRDEVRRTILHEVGHHFGMDEDELPY